MYLSFFLPLLHFENALQPQIHHREIKSVLFWHETLKKYQPEFSFAKMSDIYNLHRSVRC